MRETPAILNNSCDKPVRVHNMHGAPSRCHAGNNLGRT